MERGIYPGVSWDDYKNIDAMNPSMLKHGLRSMLRLRRAMAGECKPEPSRVAVGNAVHCLLSGEFEQRYAVMPAFETHEDNVTKTGKQSKSKSTEYYKQQSEVWTLQNADKDQLTEVQVAMASKVASLVRKRAYHLIDRSIQEVTVIGEISGVKMKTRLDGLIPKEEIVWDLKTSTDASDEAFYRIWKRLGYGFSAAVHCELLRQNEIEPREYLVIVAETEPKGDYDVRILTVPVQVIENNLPYVLRTAEEYRKAKESDTWPGLPDAPLAVPNWDMVEPDELEWSNE